MDAATVVELELLRELAGRLHRYYTLSPVLAAGSPALTQARLAGAAYCADGLGDSVRCGEYRRVRCNEPVYHFVSNPERHDRRI